MMSRNGVGRSSGVVARCDRDGSVDVIESFLIAEEGDGATVEVTSRVGVAHRIFG